MDTDDFQRHLERALCSRPVIEQAKGVLAALRAATPEQAFAELAHASQNHNVKLNVLAGALVAAAGGCEVEDACLRQVVWLEWGGCLGGRVRPLGGARRAPRLVAPTGPGLPGAGRAARRADTGT